MSRLPCVACINDLSGYGRCSLTTALPVLSVLGVQACPVPTAVLSKHTGFADYAFTDLTDSLPAYLQSWRDLHFDMIYSGFLGAEGQMNTVRDFFIAQKKQNPHCTVLLDTVMGDNGKLYDTYTPALCRAMRTLVSYADIITPNVTEACLLTDTPYHGETLHTAEAVALAEQLARLGCKAVVITGIVREDIICNMTYIGGEYTFDTVHRTKCLFSGTGDLFASVLCAALARGSTLPNAVSTAGRFLSAVTQYTMHQVVPADEGLLFEPLLRTLEDYL